MVSAVLPTPPSPNTTSLYKVIFPAMTAEWLPPLRKTAPAVSACELYYDCFLKVIRIFWGFWSMRTESVVAVSGQSSGGSVGSVVRGNWL